MTHEEQARNILMTLPTGDSGNYFHDDLVQAIAAALRDTERLVWEEAADGIAMKERKPLMVGLRQKAKVYNEAIKDCTAYCRAKAQEAR